MTRRGFTLMELTLALVLAVAVGGVAYGLLTESWRVSRSQAGKVGMQDNLRAGGLIVANELREVGFDSVPPAAALGAGAAASPDLILIQPGRVQYRAMRGLGFTCLAPSTAELRLRSASYLGLGQPGAGDSLAIYVEGEPSTSDDDAWIHARVTGAATRSCTDGTPAIGLDLVYEVAGVGAAATPRIVEGGPVRVYEAMELRYYQSGGQSWLGMRSLSAGGVIEPLLGPLADSTATERGLTFVYLDGSGSPTALPNDVREIRVTLQAVTDGPIRGGGSSRAAVDSLTLSTSIALRNALRP